jgi:hypothetical protein
VNQYYTLSKCIKFTLKDTSNPQVAVDQRRIGDPVACVVLLEVDEPNGERRIQSIFTRFLLAKLLQIGDPVACVVLLEVDEPDAEERIRLWAELQRACPLPSAMARSTGPTCKEERTAPDGDEIHSSCPTWRRPGTEFGGERRRLAVGNDGEGAGGGETLTRQTLSGHGHGKGMNAVVVGEMNWRLLGRGISY